MGVLPGTSVTDGCGRADALAAAEAAALAAAGLADAAAEAGAAALAVAELAIGLGAALLGAAAGLLGAADGLAGAAVPPHAAASIDSARLIGSKRLLMFLCSFRSVRGT